MLSAIKRLLHHSGKSNAEIKMKLVPLSIKELKSTTYYYYFSSEFYFGCTIPELCTNSGR